MTRYWHVLPPPPLLFFLLWLPIQEQETDNSGTYGGQEVMQINVSQHQYFLALQSPCREEVWGQLSIIGPQLISEEGLVQEKEGNKRKRCWTDRRSERARPLSQTGEGRKKLTKHTKKRNEHRVCKYTCCIFMTDDTFAFPLSLPSLLSLCPVLFISTCAYSCNHVCVLV